MTLATENQTKSFDSTFTVRPATMADLKAAVDLFNRCSDRMIGKKTYSQADVGKEWLLPEFQLEEATRLVFTKDQQLVGYIEVWDTDEPPVKNWIWSAVHPRYEGHGIASRLMRWAEAKVRRTIHASQVDLRVTIESGTYSHYEPADRFLTEYGMTPIRHFMTMVTELDVEPPRPIFPAGITVRHMRGIEELREVVWVVEDVFRDHWGFIEQPFELEYERWLHLTQNDPEFEPNLWFLAMAGDEIAGISLCKKKRTEDLDMGWVNTLGVRRPWRRQGLALALLRHSFGAFYALGKERAGLGVDVSSLTGAMRLYEKAGMRPIRQFTIYEKEIQAGKDIVRRALDA